MGIYHFSHTQALQTRVPYGTQALQTQVPRNPATVALSDMSFGIKRTTWYLSLRSLSAILVPESST